jgi:hypothetical protein
LAILRQKLIDGTPQERDLLLTQLNALPADVKAAITTSGQTQDASSTQKPNAPVNVFPGMPRPTVPKPRPPKAPKPAKQQPPFNEQLPIIDPPPPPDENPEHEAPQPAPGNLVT